MSPEIRNTSGSKFRTDGNIRYTRLLFKEMQADLLNEQKVIEPMFTLQHPYRDLPCFRHIYVALGDPTGYQLAIRYLEDYDHWRLLMKSPWFRAAKEIWDAELDAKLASEGMAVIRSLADGGEDIARPVQLSAAKYLADKSYRGKVVTSAPRGRPSKAEVEGNLKLESAEAASIASDMARIRGTG